MCSKTVTTRAAVKWLDWWFHRRAFRSRQRTRGPFTRRFVVVYGRLSETGLRSPVGTLSRSGSTKSKVREFFYDVTVRRTAVFASIATGFAADNDVYENPFSMRRARFSRQQYSPYPGARHTRGVDAPERRHEGERKRKGGKQPFTVQAVV